MYCKSRVLRTSKAEASIITYTIYIFFFGGGVPYYNSSVIYPPPNPILIIEAPLVCWGSWWRLGS